MSMSLDAPGRIEPGASWEKVVQATLPAPVYGGATWQVEITSEGQPTLLAKSTTSHLRGLLIVLIIVLVVDVVALAVRVVARLSCRSRRRYHHWYRRTWTRSRTRSTRHSARNQHRHANAFTSRHTSARQG